MVLILVPVEVAWEPPLVKYAAYIALEYLIDVIFLLDIFVNLRTTVVINGEEVIDPKDIVRFYIFSARFVLDVVCIL